jgi:hypothetical protein
MRDHLKIEFWNTVAGEVASKARFADSAIREEIANYLRDLEERDANDAVYHFGAEDAAKAIEFRLSAKAAKRAAPMTKRKAGKSPKAMAAKKQAG